MTAEEYWDENKHDSWVMYKKDFMFVMEEKDKETKRVIDETIEGIKVKIEQGVNYPKIVTTIESVSYTHLTLPTTPYV